MSESLSPRERIALLRTLKGLPRSTFAEVRIALGVAPEMLPGDTADQGTRATALVDWANGPLGCGEVVLKEVVDEVVSHHRATNPTLSPRTALEPKASNPRVSVESVVSTPIQSPSVPTPIQSPSVPAPSPVLSEPEKTIQIELLNGVRLDLVYIPSGVFFMGSPTNEEDRKDWEGPQHKVNVPAFYMGKYPVTQAQWYAVSLMGDIDMALSPEPSNFKGDDDRPVEQVSWDDATEFCKRLSSHVRQQGRYDGQVCRLPSEAEWEYACRANTRTRYYFGNDITPGQVNCYCKVGETTPVGQYPANGLGLYDMHGNVLEWCLDHWHESYEGAPSDGSAWLENTPQSNNRDRVFRGGSWTYNPRDCRSASRTHNSPDAQNYDIGFRVVLAPQ